VIIDNNVEFRISLFVIPNYELSQMILKHSDSVKVISPAYLVDEVKEALSAAFKKYE
jgi:predicted DNA-binding transcriptional regulator YafY